MKANEAPEKIYLFENPITETPDERWLSSKSCEEDIQYTRTDVIIKEVCEWLKTNYTEFLDSSRLGINIERLVKGLRNDFKTE